MISFLFLKRGPGPSKGGPDLKGQGQQNWARASPDQPVDTLDIAVE